MKLYYIPLYMYVCMYVCMYVSYFGSNYHNEVLGTIFVHPCKFNKISRYTCIHMIGDTE